MLISPILHLNDLQKNNYEKLYFYSVIASKFNQQKETYSIKWGILK